MKVSLLVATFNSPVALKKVLESVLLQTRIPDELVVAEDDMDEATASVVRDVSAAASFPVFHVRQEHNGFRAAKIRNEAIKHSSGDYIILLDGDCIVNRYFVADHLTLAERGYFIQGKRVHVNKEAVEQFRPEHADSVFSLFHMALFRKVSNVHHIFRMPFLPSVRNRKLKGIKSCNMGFFREDALAVNGFNEDFVKWGNEDSELACRFFKYGLLKKVHPFMAVCFHLWHPTNKTFSDETQKLLAKTVASKEYVCKNGLAKLGESV